MLGRIASHHQLHWLCAIVLLAATTVSAVTYSDKTDFVIEDQSFNENVLIVRPKGTLTIRRCSFTLLVRIDGTLALSTAVQPTLNILIDDITMQETLQIRYLNLTSESSITVKNVVGTGGLADHNHIYNYFSGTPIVFQNITTGYYFWMRYNTWKDGSTMTITDLTQPRQGEFYSGGIRLQYNTMESGSQITFDGVVGSSYYHNNIAMTSSTLIFKNSILDSDPLCTRLNCDFNITTSSFNNATVELDNVTKIGGTFRISGVVSVTNHSSFSIKNSNITHVEPTDNRTPYGMYTASTVTFEDSSLLVSDTYIVSKPVRPDLYLLGSRAVYHLAIFHRSAMTFVNSTLVGDRGNNARQYGFFCSKTFQDGSTLSIDGPTYNAMYGYAYLRNMLVGGFAKPILIENVLNTQLRFYITGTYDTSFRFVNAYVNRFEFDPGSKFDGSNAGVYMTNESRIDTLRLDGTTTGLHIQNGAKIVMDGGRITSLSATDAFLDGGFIDCRDGIVSAVTWLSGGMTGGSKFLLSNVIAYSDYELYHDMSGGSEFHVVNSDVRYGIIFHASTINGGSVVNLTGNIITRNPASSVLGEASAVHFKTGALTDSSFIVDGNTLTTTRSVTSSPSYADVAVGVHVNASVTVSGTSFVAFRGNKISAKLSSGVVGVSVLHEAPTSGSSTVVAYSSFDGPSSTVGGDIVRLRLDGSSRLDLGCVLEDVASLDVSLVGYDGAQRVLVFDSLNAASVASFTIDCAGAALAGLITNSRFGNLVLKDCAYSTTRPLVLADVAFVTGNLEYAPASVGSPVYDVAVQLNVTFEAAGKGVVTTNGGVGHEPYELTRPPMRMLGDFAAGKFGTGVESWNGARCFPPAWFSYSASASATVTPAPTPTSTPSSTSSPSMSTTPSLSRSLTKSSSLSHAISSSVLVTVSLAPTVTLSASRSLVVSLTSSLPPTASSSHTATDTKSRSSSRTVSAGTPSASEMLSASKSLSGNTPSRTSSSSGSHELTPSVSRSRSVGTSTMSRSAMPTTSVSKSRSKGTPSPSLSASPVMTLSETVSGRTPTPSDSAGPSVPPLPTVSKTVSSSRSVGPSMTTPPSPTLGASTTGSLTRSMIYVPPPSFTVPHTPSKTASQSTAAKRTASSTFPVVGVPSQTISRQPPPHHPTVVPVISKSVTAARLAASNTVTEPEPKEPSLTRPRTASAAIESTETAIPHNYVVTKTVSDPAATPMPPTPPPTRTVSVPPPVIPPPPPTATIRTVEAPRTATPNVAEVSTSMSNPCDETAAQLAIWKNGSVPSFLLGGNISVDVQTSAIGMMPNGSALISVPSDLYRVGWSRSSGNLPSDLPAMGELSAAATELELVVLLSQDMSHLHLNMDTTALNFGTYPPSAYTLYMQAGFFNEQEGCAYEVTAAIILASSSTESTTAKVTAAMTESFGTTTALASAALGASPAAAALSLAVLSDMSCARSGLRDAVPHSHRLLSPAAFDSTLPGMLYGSILLTMLLPFLHGVVTFTTGYLRGHVQNVEDRGFTSQALLRFPSWSVAALAVLHQGMLYATLKLLFVVPASDSKRHGGAGAVAAAALALMWCVALPPLCVFIAARRVEATFVRYDFAASGPGRAPHMVLQRLLPWGRWKTKAMATAYGQLFAGFGSKYAAWAAFPFVLPTVVVVCAVAEPTTTAGCARQYAALAALAVAHLGVVFVLRPFRAAMLNGLACAASVCLACVGLSAAVQVSSGGSSDGSAAVAVGMFAMLLLLVAVLWVAYALFCFFLENKLTKRVTQRVEMRRILGRGWCWGTKAGKGSPALLHSFGYSFSPRQSVADYEFEEQLLDINASGNYAPDPFASGSRSVVQVQEDVEMGDYAPPTLGDEVDDQGAGASMALMKAYNRALADDDRPQEANSTRFGNEPEAPASGKVKPPGSRERFEDEMRRRKSSTFAFSWEEKPSGKEGNSRFAALQRRDRQRRSSAYMPADPFEASHVTDPFDISPSASLAGGKPNRRTSAFAVPAFDTRGGSRRKSRARKDRRRSSSLPIVHHVPPSPKAADADEAKPPLPKKGYAWPPLDPSNNPPQTNWEAALRGRKAHRRSSSLSGLEPPTTGTHADQVVVDSGGWVYLEDRGERAHSFSL